MEDLNLFSTLDIADYNSAVSDIFEQPRNAKEWEKYMLTEEQISFFEKNGFISGIQVMTGEQADKLSYAFTRLQTYLREKDDARFCQYETDDSKIYQEVLFQAVGAWRVIPGFHELIWSPAYRMAAYQLLGGSFRLFHDQLMSKPAYQGSAVAWHQDFSYQVSTAPLQHLSCWIALDNANQDNGCLYYVPGSHHWGLLPVTSATYNMDGVKEILTDTQLEGFKKRVANVLPRGYASFHHPLTLHGSYQNLSRHQGRAVLLNAMDHLSTENINVYDQTGVLKDSSEDLQNMTMPDLPLFPLLFGADEELGYREATIPKVNVKKLYGIHMLG